MGMAKLRYPGWQKKGSSQCSLIVSANERISTGLVQGFFPATEEEMVPFTVWQLSFGSVRVREAKCKDTR